MTKPLKKITLRLPEKLHKRIKKESKSKKVGDGEYMRQALTYALDENGNH